MTDTSLPMSSETVSDRELTAMIQGMENHGSASLANVYAAPHLSALRELQSLRSKPVASGVEVRPELLAAASSLQDITFRANELGIGLAKYPVGEIEAVLQFVSLALSALLPKATAPVGSEPVAWINPATLERLAERQDHTTAILMPAPKEGATTALHTSPHPQPKAVTEEMVERARLVIGPRISRKNMRAALEAAMKEA